MGLRRNIAEVMERMNETGKLLSPDLLIQTTLRLRSRAGLASGGLAAAPRKEPYDESCETVGWVGGRAEGRGFGR